MNRIYKVIYSKVRQCYVVVSELAKKQGKKARSEHTLRENNRSYRLAAIVALTISAGSLLYPMQAEAWTDDSTNNYFTAYDKNYFDQNGKRSEDWKQVKPSNTNQDKDRVGAKNTGAIAAGMFAQAGQQTVTIGNRNAGASMGSVYVGEYKNYSTPTSTSVLEGVGNNYVTSVGFMSNATKYGTIAIGAGASAKGEDNNVTLGNKDSSGTLVSSLPDPETLKIHGASVSLGYSAQSEHGNIAIGAYSDATTDLSDGKSDTPKSYLTGDTATSYVSVGGKDVQRRISNVADGASASDVATVGQLQALSKELGGYKAGFGITIATDSTDKTKNTISLDRNLGTNYTDKKHKGDEKVTVNVNDTGLVLGGYAEDAGGNKNNPEVTYGATGDDSVTVGGKNGLASGRGSVAAGGMDNVASGINATVVGGDYNNAAGTQAAVLGGLDNTASGTDATASGGSYNVANGIQSAVLGGYSNNALGTGTTSIGGYGKAYDGQNNVIYDSSVNGMYSVGIAGGSTGKDAGYALAAGNQAVVTVENGTAIGYQATTDEANTIAFGHDAGDVSGYTIKWKQRTDGKTNADGTTNDYTQAPESVVAKDPYTKAGYNRLVKVADGVDPHDVVVMEQLNKAQNDLKVNAGWGINIEDVTTKDENGKEMTKKNVISLKRNLGKNYGSRYGTGKVNFEADGENSLILGGGALNDSWEDRDKEVTYGAHGKDSILVGGLNNDIAKDSEKIATSIGTKVSIGTRAVIIGGTSNTVSYDPVTEKDPDTGKEKVKVDSNGNVIVQTQKTGTDAIIVGGLQNTAKGDGSVLIGGESNEATGFYSTVIGGTSNKTDGWLSSIFGGTKNTITGAPTAAGIFGGTGNTINSNGIAANVFGGENNTADNTLAVVVGGEANTSSGPASIILGGNHNTANQLLATVVGGQLNTATGETSMISGGIGNVTSGRYSYASGGLYNNATGIASSALGGRSSSVNGMFSTGVAGGSTGQDAFFSLAAGYKSVVADSGVEKTFITGDESEKIQEDIAAGKELSGFYMGDPSDMPELGHTGTLIHYDKFSTALGYQATADEAGTIAFGHDAGDESGYTYEWEQLPKDKDGYQTYANDGTTNDYTKPPKSVKKKAPYTSAYYNRLVKIADGKDAHDAVTVEQLNKVQNDLDTSKTHFYNVNSKDTEAGNYNNDGAKGAGSMAAGFNTHADGIASTVAGSYSGVVGTGLQGATALSYGTFNINQNTDVTKEHSGVANSIIGQANATTDSNAAIIYGAGNTVTNSYRDIDTKKFDLNKVKQDIAKKDAAAVAKDLQQAVPTSGGQVMVMGGGNSVEKAYMTQVTGVGNTVTGSGTEYGTDSTQLNYIEGFYTTLTNGKNDYIIGAHNTVTGDTTAQNQSNIVFGDNHKLTNTKNNLILGSSDTADDETTVSDVVSIGHNAKVTKEGGVAIGSGSEATTAAGVAGYDPTGATADTTAAWTSKKAAVSVGTADETRQINGVAAGKEETDAVNVAQLKKLNGMKANVDATNIGKNLKGADGKTAASDAEKTANENAWGTAIGTGEIAEGNGQLVTGKTVYAYNKPVAAEGKTLNYISDTNTTGQNLTALDTQVKSNAGNIGTNTTNISNLQNGEGFTDKGNTYIKNLAKGSIGMENGSHTTVSHRDVNGVETYKVDVKVDGEVKSGNKGIVDGGTVYSALQDAQTQINGDLSGKANVDASNITDKDAWGTAIGTGSIAAGNGQLVTGNTVYAYNKPVAAEGKTLNYISDTNTTGQNLTALDTQVKSNAGNIGTNTTNISNLQNGEGFTDKGNTYIKNLAKGSIGMENGSHTTVSHRDVNGVETYKVDVKVDGEVKSGNKGIVDGGAVYSAIQDVKNQTSADLANKANVDASNLTPNNVTKWQEKLGNGKVESGNTGLVTGDTVFKAVDTKANRDGSNLTTDEANKFSEKIAVGKVEANDKRAVSGDAVSQAISKVTGDMNTQLDGKANTSLDNITKDGQNVIRDLAKGSVKVIDGTNTTVTTVEGKGETPTTYAVNVEGKGTVTSGNTGLISGGTAYTELRPADGSYVKQSNTTATNLTALDTQLKTTSDLIHTNTTGDTIQIGGSSKATKIDVNGKDGGRVITGVVTDAGDPTSAANVGYVNNAYGRLNNNINKAAAGSNALAALHPLDYDPDDKADFAVGYGHYRNANAAAVGAFYHPNENTMVNVGVSLGNGDPGFNAGVSFKIGSGSAGHQAMSKTEMAKVINSQSKEIDALKKDNADKDKRIDALEQKMAEILAKLDKNGK